ncbi:amino acid/polyamine transporter I [Trichoderma evansii]
MGMAGQRDDAITRQVEDAGELQELGVEQELQRNFSTASMIGLAFAGLNSWTALSTSLNLALPSGGPSAVIWGLVTAGVCNLCLAASLGEFLSAFPTAGGQYHWAAMVSWPRISRGISFVTGWINVGAWVAMAATGGLLGSTLIMNIIALESPNFEPKPWQQFLIYIAFTLVAFVINAFTTRLLPIFGKIAFAWSIIGFFIISITILGTASPTYQSGEFVYGTLINNTGWPDGLAWLIGLLQGAFALTGFDATIHMIEEIPNPKVEGPKIMLTAIGIGTFTGFVFVSCLLFTLTDIDEVNNSLAGPLLTILYQATRNRAAAICLLMFPVICMVFTSTALMTTSSRMSYAFARDRGLPFSHIFAKVHPTLNVPLNALIWTASWIIVLGCIFLGSTSAFNAIVSASVVAIGITYAIPPGINCLRRRKMLPDSRPFKMHNTLGWIANIIGIVWTIITTVLFLFPPEPQVTPSNMNYAVAALGILFLIATFQWIFDGRKNYKGPQLPSINELHIIDGGNVVSGVPMDKDGKDSRKDA